MIMLHALLARLTSPCLALASGMLVVVAGCGTEVPRGSASQVGERTLWFELPSRWSKIEPVLTSTRHWIDAAAQGGILI